MDRSQSRALLTLGRFKLCFMTFIKVTYELVYLCRNNFVKLLNCLVSFEYYAVGSGIWIFEKRTYCTFLSFFLFPGLVFVVVIVVVLHWSRSYMPL